MVANQRSVSACRANEGGAGAKKSSRKPERRELLIAGEAPAVDGPGALELTVVRGMTAVSDVAPSAAVDQGRVRGRRE